MKNIYKSLSLSAIAAVAGSFLFIACSKTDTSTVGTGQIPAQNQTIMKADVEADLLYDDIFLTVVGVDSSVSFGGTGVFADKRRSNPDQRTTPCYTVSWEFLNQNDSFPVKITVDFGDGCLGWDGRTRKGKVSTIYSSPLWLKSATAITALSDYWVDGVKVEGTHQLTNKSTTSQLIFETKVTNGKLTRPNVNLIAWSGQRLFTQKAGWETGFDPTDDVYTIVGNGKGTIQNTDTTYTWTGYNIEPLEKAFSCQWVAKGKQAIEGKQGPQGILDFGNGDCDNKASFTVNGVSVEITLK